MGTILPASPDSWTPVILAYRGGGALAIIATLDSTLPA